MQISKLFTASVTSLTLALSPLIAQNVFAQSVTPPTAASLSGSGVTATVVAPAGTAVGAGAATGAAVGGLTPAAIVGGVVVVGAAVAIAVSSNGSGSSGTTGTTGTTAPN